MLCLLVEDHDDLAATIADFLTDRGFVVDVASTGSEALRLVRDGHYEALVLDRGLPDIDGLEVCRILRDAEATRTIPILVLTARDTVPDRLEGFVAGADDYLIKPFSLEELAARLVALERRSRPHQGARRLAVGDLALDLDTLEVERAGRPLHLPPIQLRLLEVLLRESHRVVRRDELERAIWGDDPPDSDALKTHLHTLRSIVDRPFGSALIHTVPRAGYRLSVAL